MVRIDFEKDETRLEDRVVIHSKTWDSPYGLIEAPDVEILLVFKDGRLDSIQSSAPTAKKVEKV